MFIFLRWLLAHLIGDFPLQTNRIHALKHQSLKGFALHILIIVFCFIVLTWPYLDLPGIWLLILLIGTSHFLQDWAKIKITGSTKNNFLFYLLDQILHVAFISLVFFTDLAHLGPLQKTGRLAALYNNDSLILFFIMIIAVSYNGHYMILLFKKDYWNIEDPCSPFEKWYGMLERTLIVSLFLGEGQWFLAVFVILSLRPLLFYLGKDNLSVNRQFISMKEIALSGICGIVVGILAHCII